MADPNPIAGIIATYEKHGWILRRVLLSDAAKQSLGPYADTLPVTASDIDAAWFSRPPKSGGTAWEIRYLGGVPFALVENLDENSPSFENDIAALQERLRDAVSARKSA
jgi:hypothetical protein